MLKKIILLVLFIVIGYFWYLNSQTPSADREWNVDQTVPAEAIFNDDEVTIKNVRNFTYRSVSDYTPNYYDTTVNLNDLVAVDYIIEPFGSIGAAHTFLSFGFKNGQYIAISIEIRKEVGEVFSPWLGLLNQYELMYVIADERDVIGLRANYRHDDVYLYPTLATPEQARTLFVSMLKRANKLEIEPEFYNTVTGNCTTNIAAHINEITPNRIGYDLRLLLPENSDALAKELGLILPDLTLEEGRAKYKVNDKAKEYEGQADFSNLIRQDLGEIEEGSNLETKTQSLSYKVSRIIDGDTIEVTKTGVSKIVRYIGINTPEVAGPNTNDECFGKEASAYNKELVLGKEVRLEKDVSEEDKYGRWLRYVYVDDVFVNEDLVTKGYAKAKSYPPDTSYNSILNTAQTKAKMESRGLWSAACAA